MKGEDTLNIRRNEKMRRKKGLFAVVAALAVSTMMAAMAYSNGYVHNTSYVKISSSNQSLLAVIPKDATTVGYKDATAHLDKFGAVQFDFGKNGDGAFAGMQAGSRYTWENLVDLQNNSSDNVKVRITIDTNSPLGKYLTIYDTTNKAEVYSAGKGPATDFIIEHGAIHNLKFEFILPHNAVVNDKAAEGSIVLNVSAVQ
jgi:hypothetical protein